MFRKWSKRSISLPVLAIQRIDSYLEKCRSRSAISRILSVDCRSGRLCVHLSTSPKRSPCRGRVRHTRNHLDEPPDSLCCLAPEWVYRAFIVASEAVSSYLPFSPLPFAEARGGLFSVTLAVKTGFPALPLFSQGFLPYGVRTFLSF